MSPYFHNFTFPYPGASLFPLFGSPSWISSHDTPFFHLDGAFRSSSKVQPSAQFICFLLPELRGVFYWTRLFSPLRVESGSLTFYLNLSRIRSPLPSPRRFREFVLRRVRSSSVLPALPTFCLTDSFGLLSIVSLLCSFLHLACRFPRCPLWCLHAPLYSFPHVGADPLPVTLPIYLQAFSVFTAPNLAPPLAGTSVSKES